MPLLQATEDGYFQLVMPKTPEKNEHAGKVYGDLQMLQEQLGIPALNVDSKEQEQTRTLKDPRHCLQVVTHILCREEGLKYERLVARDDYEDFLPLVPPNAPNPEKLVNIKAEVVE